MSAFVEHKFERGFVLDEARARKLHELVTTRLKKLSTEPTLQYKVYRGDSYSYVTQSVNDVIGEQNEDWRRLTRLELFAKENTTFEMKLIFERDNGIELTISGDDRDSVFLLLSDLREYIHNDVAVVFMLEKHVCSTIAAILSCILLAILFFPFASRPKAPPESVKKALESIEIPQKLDFLITQAGQSDAPPIWVLLGLICASTVTIIIPEFSYKLIRFAFPFNQFLFGAIKDKYERRSKFLSNVFWVVFVGILVSIFGSIIVWYVTTK